MIPASFQAPCRTSWRPTHTSCFTASADTAPYITHQSRSHRPYPVSCIKVASIALASHKLLSKNVFLSFNSLHRNDMANAFVYNTQDSQMAGIAFESADTSPEVARTALRQACRDLSDRGLIMATRWAAELLQSVPASIPSASTEPPAIRTSTPNRPRPSLPGLPPNISIAPAGGGPSSPIAGAHDISYDFYPEARASTSSKAMDPLDAQELDQYMMGKAYYDNKELDRAAKVLKSCRSNRARFLCLYSRYLVSCSDNYVQLVCLMLSYRLASDVCRRIAEPCWVGQLTF